MPDPALPAVLRAHAHSLRTAATRVSAEVASVPWRSFAAGAMRDRAGAVTEALLVAAVAVEATASDLGAAHAAAVVQVERLRAELTTARAVAEQAGRDGATAVRRATDLGTLVLADTLRRAEVAAHGLLR